MKNLSKEKRDRLILVGIGTAAVCVGICFGLVKTQNKTIVNLGKLAREQNDKVENANRLINNSTQVAANLELVTQKLKSYEDGMATGDMYAWMITTINRFKQPYKVEIPMFSREVQCEVGLLPRFPYKAALFNVRGTAYFHDLGKFISDLENAFPFMRVQNLEIDPVVASNAAAPGEDVEKLAFRLEIITLVNTQSR